MALDYQKSLYRRGPKSKLSKTSYGQMNQWTDEKTCGPRHSKSSLPPHGFFPEDPPHVQYYKSGGYDDFHKTYLKMHQQGLAPKFPNYGPPALRSGNGGGSWRHVKQVLQAEGSRNLFVDGQQRIQDNNKLLNEEVPAANVIQPVAQNTFRREPKPWTAHELNAFKAAEGQNYMIMR